MKYDKIIIGAGLYGLYKADIHKPGESPHGLSLSEKYLHGIKKPKLL